MGRVILCADAESCMHPELIGLGEISFGNKEWLMAFASAYEARTACASGDADEAWLVSNDDMDAINLCAAIRKDNPSLPIYFVSDDASGFELSRASQAGANAILSTVEFASRMEAEARKRMLIHETEEIDIDAGLEEISYESKAVLDATPNPNSFIVSVLSGSGGVGKSSLCAIAAHLCAARGFKVAVIDCDLQFGDMHQIMGNVPTVSIDNVLANEESLLEVANMVEPFDPVVISAPSRLECSETLSECLGELMVAVSQVFDMVFVNTGASWAEHHAQLLELSNCSVFMLDQRASSVRTCKHALDLCMRMGIASGSFVYALNKCDRHALFTSVDIANSMEGAHVFELKDGGLEVEEMLGSGLAGELSLSKNPFCQSVVAMLEEVLP